MALQQFDPPGYATDLSVSQKTGWSNIINSWIEAERTALPSGYNKFFFNELQQPDASTGQVAEITWEGFPRIWKLKFPTDELKRWIASEKLYNSNGIIFRYQDEYLEWLSFNNNNKLEKVVFTCEGPEYWNFIADQDEQLLLQLYRSLAGPSVQATDLFTGTGVSRRYNPSNKWNTTEGIVHLTQPNNTLGAEIDLAAKASVLRKKGAVDPVTDSHDLICCSGFGAEERFSDPTIGAAVNSFVRQGLSVTLNNPIGLYIRRLKTSGIEVPNGFQVKDFWNVVRGNNSKGMILRAEFKVPAGATFSLEDVKVGGKPLKFGAQLAEMIEMVIYGKAFKLENSPPHSLECDNYCNQVDMLSADHNFGLIEEKYKPEKAISKIGLRMIKFEANEL